MCPRISLRRQRCHPPLRFFAFVDALPFAGLLPFLSDYVCVVIRAMITQEHDTAGDGAIELWTSETPCQ